MEDSGMTKIVYNGCFGGFNLSTEAVKLARKISGDPKWGDCALKGEFYSDGSLCTVEYNSPRDLPRHDDTLVRVVEELGDRANGDCARLKIADIPSGTFYRIDEYAGNESVETNATRDMKYILYDGGYDERVEYDTLEEAMKAAQHVINGYRDACDPEWPEYVEDISVTYDGKVVARSEMTNIVNCPDDFDECGYSPSLDLYFGCVDFYCDYEMVVK
jgi:hypothetical protein